MQANALHRVNEAYGLSNMQAQIADAEGATASPEGNFKPADPNVQIVSSEGTTVAADIAAAPPEFC
jgi:hypothetical protein